MYMMTMYMRHLDVDSTSFSVDVSYAQGIDKRWPDIFKKNLLKHALKCSKSPNPYLSSST